jgi:hypothetical protein
MNIFNLIFPELGKPLPIKSENFSLHETQYFNLNDFEKIGINLDELYEKLQLLNYDTTPSFGKEMYDNQYLYVFKSHTVSINDVIVNFVINNTENNTAPRNRKYSIYVDKQLLFMIKKTSSINDEYVDYEDLKYQKLKKIYTVTNDNYFSLKEIKLIYPKILEYLNSIWEVHQTKENNFELIKNFDLRLKDYEEKIKKQKLELITKFIK